MPHRHIKCHSKWRVDLSIFLVGLWRVSLLFFCLLLIFLFLLLLLWLNNKYVCDSCQESSHLRDRLRARTWPRQTNCWNLDKSTSCSQQSYCGWEMLSIKFQPSWTGVKKRKRKKELKHARYLVEVICLALLKTIRASLWYKMLSPFSFCVSISKVVLIFWLPCWRDAFLKFFIAFLYCLSRCLSFIHADTVLENENTFLFQKDWILFLSKCFFFAIEDPGGVLLKMGPL